MIRLYVKGNDNPYEYLRRFFDSENNKNKIQVSA